MVALATVADVEARLPRPITPEEATRVGVLLGDASAVVRNYTRRHFTTLTETVRLRPTGTRLRLPQRPVTAVNSVAIVGQYPPALLPTPFLWDGGDEVYVGFDDDSQYAFNHMSDLVLETIRDTTPLVEVNYTHGYAQVPDDVKAVVATMVARAVLVPDGGIYQAQGTGPYNFQFSATAQAGAMGLDAAGRQILNSYRRVATSVEMR